MRKSAGADKAELAFGDAPSLWEYQANRLSALFEQVYLSVKNPPSGANHQYSYIKDIDGFLDNGAQIELREVYSPLVGLLSSLEKLQCKEAFFLPVDTPFLSPNYITLLIGSFSPDMSALAAKTKEKVHPLCAVYSNFCVPKLKENLASGRHKLTQFLDEIGAEYLEFEDEAEFFNINDKNEYETALGMSKFVTKGSK